MSVAPRASSRSTLRACPGLDNPQSRDPARLRTPLGLLALLIVPGLQQPLEQRLFEAVELLVIHLAGTVAALELGHLRADGGGVVVATLGLVEDGLQDPFPAEQRD